MIIKICGITSIAAAKTAKECGADLIGFVFAPSKRQIRVEEASRISYEIKGIRKVGVFVDAPLTEVHHIARACRLDFVQLHGQESAEYCSQVGYPIIKACRVSRVFDVSQVDEDSANIILCDSFVPGSQGGTGVAFDWLQARNVLKKIKKPVLVAGGLNAQNVKDAVRILNPAGVDVSGGVETNGIKDAEKIERFIKAARAAEGGCRYA